jgi:UDP-N-acetylmuramoyl-L-alanyl-D-glutamate--2,6-diaminopimelate ligase
MTFDELLNIVDSANSPGLCVDSRLVKPGNIFVAVPGTSYDGHNFIDKAIEKGAKYIVCQRPVRCENAEVIIVDDSAKAAGLLAQAFYGRPASKLINLAVTGTNGKTTIAFLVRSIIQSAGQKCGLIGTVVYDSVMNCIEAPLTTPDYLTIADMTAQMVKAGAKYMAVEASSHSLAQSRLAGVNFRAAAFTNLTGDHLDYHKTKQEYLAAKLRLFESLSADATAVLNKESPEAEQIAARTKAKILWYAVDVPADITAHVESMDIAGTTFVLEYAGKKKKVKIHLSGRYNVSNSLAAAGLCLAAGLDLETITAGLSSLKAIPGRLEKIEWNGNFTVIVDFAHTDDALKNVLSTLRPLCKGRLIIVFGCGGDRDRTKRPRMAKVTEQLADFIVVTSDNPRTEKPEDIIKEVAAGFSNPSSSRIIFEPDRAKAIEIAVKKAVKDDIVLIAGKGHEAYQIIGKQKFDFSDKAVALECLGKRK